MNELRTLLADTTARVLADAKGKSPAEIWPAITEAGLPKVLTSEESGGFGGTWEDALVVIEACGHHATTAPLPEAILAAHLAQTAKLDSPDAMVTIATHAQGALSGTNFTGTLRFVPWGRDAAHVLTAEDGKLLLLNTADAKIEPHQNPASEPRDTLHFTNAPVQTASFQTNLFADLALLRTAQIAGALAHALDLSVQYTKERQQFGRALAQFQAIQQQLAILAEETAAAGMAAAAAFRARDQGDAGFEIAAAKLRANRAARTATGIAHQVHGAMGFTAEYSLHPLTTRLWAWQSEAGNERHWAESLGKTVAKRGYRAFWPDLVARSE
ncbi:MAG TPA: acyl-CoA dehydrogenase family protein [Rhizomicrobium sp.]|nr:acyl-CoA dehydrogenase family protein [Rhizomicrobium sp.]